MDLLKPRVLLVDDEAGLRELVQVYLENSGFEVIEAADGLKAEAELKNEAFDLVILDVMMPQLDGLTLCRMIRSSQVDLPILLLTAKGEEADRLLGFEYGADDYVVKPFSPRELTARAKALLRRSVKFQQTNEALLRYPNLLIDNARHWVEWFNQEIILTPKEFSLLILLAKKPLQVYSREQIMSLAWGEDYLAELRIVDVHVKNLREKFNSIAPFNYLQTVWGIGYKFEVPR
ncbi:response regulator with CheY-like receiver domain and winged-helix DNA-binding domain [Desulfosporosinus acidiphilus SJ4]|uniref:Stage 0 sporulation protein A homolog n=1 Tax=Desulfosporosinus acidiphilus (strain DSM 22704 / JCM 16185 / SJ4) TaxID=646529 RepID=I4D2B4_DESAJ|nr:response regulator transcription factor [Desulfosporosinus acidiphilus]AFM39938.1 response regulator with CheY-like receiver domain and winged-helix DNA-binding domain [Desulfosporosinus acidiphilus SJ4]